MTRAIPLRLEGPMQAWGGPVAGDDRPTLRAPTKSGVLGIVAGAMGIDRAEAEHIRSLHKRFALVVRVDFPGVAGLDFQTVMKVPNADFELRNDPVVSRREYLYDAAFTVLLVERAVVDEVLEEIAERLRYPKYLPFLGRRACPPAVPMLIPPGILEGPSWRAILDAVPSPDAFGRNPGGGEILVDADLVELGPGVTEHRVRDVTAGPSARFFDERAVRRLGNDTTGGWGA